MAKITTTEFKNNFGKYIKLAQEEEIEVTKRDVTIFRIVPERLELLKEAREFLGSLPKGATIGKDPDERG